MAAPKPKSPPEYPDVCGKHRLQAEVQGLSREMGLLEEELHSVDGLQPASRSCKEVNEYVGTNPDPLVPSNTRGHKHCRIWMWIRAKLCLNFSWLCCACRCSCKFRKPSCSCNIFRNCCCCCCNYQPECYQCQCTRCCCWDISKLFCCCRRPSHCCNNPCSCCRPRCPKCSCGCVFSFPSCTDCCLCPKCTRPCCVSRCLCP